MQRILLVVQYDGRNFYGWQKQSGRRTVEEELEKAVNLLTSEDVKIFASGRTDRGVHAIGQTVHFDLETSLPVKNLPVALNNLLPNDISVKSARKVSQNFHARFDVKRKTYLYVVHNDKIKNAIYAAFSANVSFSLDIDLMREAASLLIGKHNFKAFCASGAKVTDFEREIFDIKIKKKGKFIMFEVCGNGFLYNMVRIIVGTLVDIGRGNLEKNCILDAFSSGKRGVLGKTMPAEGLFLKKVEY